MGKLVIHYIKKKKFPRGIAPFKLNPRHPKRKHNKANSGFIIWQYIAILVKYQSVSERSQLKSEIKWNV